MRRAALCFALVFLTALPGCTLVFSFAGMDNAARVDALRNEYVDVRTLDVGEPVRIGTSVRYGIVGRWSGIDSATHRPMAVVQPRRGPAVRLPVDASLVVQRWPARLSPGAFTLAGVFVDAALLVWALREIDRTCWPAGCMSDAY